MVFCFQAQDVRFILYISCPKSDQSNFFKEPWFLSVESDTYKPNLDGEAFHFK